MALVGTIGHAYFPGCGEKLGRMAQHAGVNMGSLPAEQQKFIREQLGEFLGTRVVRSDENVYREWVKHADGSGFTLKGFGEGNDINVTWVKGGPDARFRYRIERNGNRTFFVPKGYDFNAHPDRGKGVILEGLRGHTLHPYAGSERAQNERLRLGEPALVEKEVQKQAVEAYKGAIEQGDDAFLFVGPTGVGKTIVMLGIMKERINANLNALARWVKGGKKDKRPPSIHVAFANTDGLVDKMYKDLQKVDADGEFEVYRWGGGKETDRTPMDFEAMVKRSQETGKPIIIVTTDRSLVGRAGKGTNPSGLSPAELAELTPIGAKTQEQVETEQLMDLERAMNVELLANHVDTFIVDEAHHVGAPQTVTLLEEVRRKAADVRGKAPVRAGFSATPDRSDMDLIEKVFHGRAFWGYLDTAEGYLAHRGASDRPISDILHQLDVAQIKGESHPFQTFFLDPARYGNAEKPLFIPATRQGEQPVMDPVHYNDYFESIRAVIERNDHLFFATSSIEEANLMAQHAKTQKWKLPSGQPHRIAVLHSGINPETGKIFTQKEKDQMRKDFEEGKYTALFTVGMMDEGYDVKGLSAYIDTNMNVNPKALIQRIGRVLRMTEGKVKRSDIVTFTRVDEESTAEALLELKRIGSRGEHELEEDEFLPEERGGGGEEKEPRARLALPARFAPAQAWSADDLSQVKSRFFDAKLRNKKAVEHFDRLSKIVGVRGEIDAFQTPEHAHLSDLMSQMIDEDSTVSRSFNALVANNPAMTAAVENFRKKRDGFRAAYKDPRSTGKAFLDFLQKYKRFPRENLSDEELRFFMAYTQYKESVPFLVETHGKVEGFLGTAMNTEPKIKAILEDTGKTLEAADDFYTHYGKEPDSKAPGFEGQLGKAVAQIVDPKRSKYKHREREQLLEKHVKNDMLLFELVVRTEPPEELAPSNAPKPTAATPAATFSKAIARFDRAKAGIPAKPLQSVTVELKGSEGGTKQMLAHYKLVGSHMGLVVKEKPLPAGGRDQAAFELEFMQSDGSPAPSDLLAFETGNHRVVYTEKGARYTNDVRVVVKGIGDAPKPNDPIIRKYQLHLAAPVVSDSRVDGNASRKIGRTAGETHGELVLDLLKAKN